MSLFVLGDMHLSLEVNKPMDVFGGWENYVSRIEENWKRLIKPEDTIVLAGDFSWGMNLEQSKKDFEFVNNLNGTKILLKGNHDYWWGSLNKIHEFFSDNNFDTFKILHINHYKWGKYGICGSRGWVNEDSNEADKKILLREATRLEMSIQSALKEDLIPIVFLHYPPIYGSNENYYILEILHKYKVKQCYYGHLHGNSTKYAINGDRGGVMYRLISSDFLQFEPLDITDFVQSVIS